MNPVGRTSQDHDRCVPPGASAHLRAGISRTRGPLRVRRWLRRRKPERSERPTGAPECTWELAGRRSRMPRGAPPPRGASPGRRDDLRNSSLVRTMRRAVRDWPRGRYRFRKVVVGWQLRATDRRILRRSSWWGHRRVGDRTSDPHPGSPGRTVLTGDGRALVAPLRHTRPRGRSGVPHQQADVPPGPPACYHQPVLGQVGGVIDGSSVLPTTPGTDPPGALLAKQSTRERQRKALPVFRSPQTPVTSSVGRGAAADDERDADDERHRPDEYRGPVSGFADAQDAKSVRR